ncbi:MAG: hypothetical protein LBC53_05395 [Spirochaetaceae bacterium]|jgi:cell fate regulator YaaT (PSP1 superfamily)|nr:hypothetical protein [Spirochaetaceae bacterium]
MTFLTQENHFDKIQEMKNEGLADESENLDNLEDDDFIDDGIVESAAGENLTPGTPVYHLRLACSSETFYAVYEGAELFPKSQVVVSTRYGRDLAVVIRQIKDCKKNVSKVARIERPATEKDLERARYNAKLEEKAFQVCHDLIKEQNLDMKLLAAHYLLEDPKIVFFYTAERRVDFRALLKGLVAYFKVRIELRQIVFRDDSKIHGGMGVCGRDFCCHSVFERLKPISIRMAKDQKLSLNTMKISGPCEKLLCCLSFEHDFYQEQIKLMPPEGFKIAYDGAIWKVVEVNVVLGVATLSLEDGRRIYLPKTQFEKVEGRWQIKKNQDKQSEEAEEGGSHG